jgi:hypothetical protein
MPGVKGEEQVSPGASVQRVGGAPGGDNLTTSVTVSTLRTSTVEGVLLPNLAKRTPPRAPTMPTRSARVAALREVMREGREWGVGTGDWGVGIRHSAFGIRKSSIGAAQRSTWLS